MKTLFHGTTFDNYLDIVKNGFNSYNKIWNCSGDEDVYFYDLDKNDGDNMNEKSHNCIHDAFTNGAISASLNGYNKNSLVVIEYSINREYVYDDYSCQNMNHVASVVNSYDLIKYGTIKNVYIMTTYNPHFRFFYLASIFHNNYLNTGILNRSELEACEAISNIEWCSIHEDLYCFEWSTYKENDLKLVA